MHSMTVFDESLNERQELYKKLIEHAAHANMLSPQPTGLRSKRQAKKQEQLQSQRSYSFEEPSDVRYPSGRKRHVRRCANEIVKEFQCPYDQCTKSYGAEGSLNLHIKQKHKGGNKTQRLKVARDLLRQQALAVSIEDIEKREGFKLTPGDLEKAALEMSMEQMQSDIQTPSTADILKQIQAQMSLAGKRSTSQKHRKSPL